ncbi:hypothetical protein DPEC_G00346360 [Dallia pectoralis]|uniref:Uncharacterized protein n=1 Tax=Dallia pectoralis TaxID=75939 RepID=A0ACC2F3Q8_DALPE|nr:hypothetical protein DPEC_G00346360 [Dallia pectoralis]
MIPELHLKQCCRALNLAETHCDKMNEMSGGAVAAVGRGNGHGKTRRAALREIDSKHRNAEPGVRQLGFEQVSGDVEQGEKETEMWRRQTYTPEGFSDADSPLADRPQIDAGGYRKWKTWGRHNVLFQLAGVSWEAMQSFIVALTGSHGESFGSDGQALALKQRQPEPSEQSPTAN